jgi:ABC-type transport system substrate-binding protein
MPSGIAALVVVLSATGCRSASETDTAPPTLRVGVGIGRTARGSGLNVLREMLYAEPLVGSDRSGKPVENLAESLSWEDGRKSLHLRLRRGVLFHDGSNLTSDIVRRSVEDQIRQRGGELGFANVVEITTPAPDVVIIRLSQPDNFLVSALSGVRITHPDAPQVGTGPFVLTNTDAAIVETRRFDQYHQGPSPLAGVVIRTYDTQRSAWGALMRSEVDAVQEVNRGMVEFIEGNTNVRAFPMLQPFHVAMVLNQRHRVLRNVEVRRALIEAVDRDMIIRRAMNGLGEPADSPIWPRHWAYTPAARPLRQDGDSARLRLDRAGYPLPSDGNGKARVRFTFKCLFWSEEVMYERIAMRLQRQLFDVGVDVVLQPATLETIAERMAAGTYDAVLAPMNASRSLELAYTYWRTDPSTGRSSVNSGYRGVDAAFDRFRLSASEQETRAAVAELVQRFHDDAPAVFIAWLNVTRAVHTRFTIGDPEKDDPFAHIWQWRPATGPLP